MNNIQGTTTFRDKIFHFVRQIDVCTTLWHLLQQHQIKGSICSVHNNPVGNLVLYEFLEHVKNVEIKPPCMDVDFMDGTSRRYILPEGVLAFIETFNEGKYPELEE